jgi:hypothetical protein
MGDFWSSDPASTDSPTRIVWRAAFPKTIQNALVSTTNPTGTITNSDLELVALITGVAVGASTPSTSRHVLHCASDNTPALAWSTRGSTSSNTAPAYLLRQHAQLARQRDYTLRSVFTPGTTNILADFCSRSCHLLDAAFLHAVNHRFPSRPCWTLAHPTRETLSHMTSALSRKMQPWVSAIPEPMRPCPPGTFGSTFAPPYARMPTSNPQMTPSSYYDCLPNATALANWLPAVLQSELARWKMPFTPLARR